MLKRTLRLLQPYWIFITVTGLSLTIALCARLYAPRLMQKIIDHVIIQRSTTIMTWLPLLLISLLLPPVLFSLANYLTAWTGQRIAASLKEQIFEHLLYRGMSFFDDIHTGELINQMMSETQQAVLNLTGINLQQIIKAVITAIVATIMMIDLNPPLALACLFAFPLAFLPIRILTRYGESFGEKYMVSRNEAASILAESILGIRLVAANNQQTTRLRAFQHCNKIMINLWAKIVCLDSLNELWSTYFIEAIGTALLFSLGTASILNGSLSIGGLIAFLAYVPLLYSALSTIPTTQLDWAKNRAILARAYDYADHESEVLEKENAQILQNVSGKLEFCDVTFNYASRENNTLNKVNFTVEAGEFIGLVGPSGSGKSTIIDLLLRFYELNSGKILVDGIDIRDITIESLRRNIAVVPQDAFLFNASVRENLLFGNDHVSEERMIEAACTAQIHEFINGLPDKYDTLLGERGVKLSGGEKQRISIARALLKKAPIIIFDEATSALDTITEAALQRSLRPLLGKATMIVIAHRINTIAHADRIIMFDKSQIVEMGKYNELLAAKGVFANLVNDQISPRKA